MDLVLEACVDSAASAESAARGGATRLELCENLVIGGTSPSEELFDLVQERAGLPVRVLLRPRFGDFCYTEDEFEIILRQVKRFSRRGADGVVIGVLKPDGTLDEERMARLIEAAGDVGVTLHRAFDVCRDPFEALAAAARLGVDTILTSGQQNACEEGAELLAALDRASGGKPRIMAGAGVSAEVIRRIGPQTGLTAFHLSGKKTVDSPMVYRRSGVSMGLKGLSEYEIWRCDEAAIRAAREALQALA